jgi:hypothetical protein
VCGRKGSIEAPYTAPWPAACQVLNVCLVSETVEIEVVKVEKCSNWKGQGGEKCLTSNKKKKS